MIKPTNSMDENNERYIKNLKVEHPEIDYPEGEWAGHIDDAPEEIREELTELGEDKLREEAEEGLLPNEDEEYIEKDYE